MIVWIWPLKAEIKVGHTFYSGQPLIVGRCFSKRSHFPNILSSRLGEECPQGTDKCGLTYNTSAKLKGDGSICCHYAKWHYRSRRCYPSLEIHRVLIKDKRYLLTFADKTNSPYTVIWPAIKYFRKKPSPAVSCDGQARFPAVVYSLCQSDVRK